MATRLSNLAADKLIAAHTSPTIELETHRNDEDEEKYDVAGAAMTQTEQKPKLKTERSASYSATSMANRRKSLIFRPPTVTSQKDIRTVCFYLAVHGIIIGFVGWCINILLSLLYGINSINCHRVTLSLPLAQCKQQTSATYSIRTGTLSSWISSIARLSMNR